VLPTILIFALVLLPQNSTCLWPSKIGIEDVSPLPALFMIRVGVVCEQIMDCLGAGKGESKFGCISWLIKSWMIRDQVGQCLVL